MTVEYLKYRADLNFEVGFGSNGPIVTIVSWRDLILFGKYNHFHTLHNIFSKSEY